MKTKNDLINLYSLALEKETEEREILRLKAKIELLNIKQKTKPIKFQTGGYPSSISESLFFVFLFPVFVGYGLVVMIVEKIRGVIK